MDWKRKPNHCPAYGYKWAFVEGGIWDKCEYSTTIFVNLIYTMNIVALDSHLPHLPPHNPTPYLK